MSDFSPLDDWLQALLSRLSPAQMVKVNRIAAQRMRQEQRERITSQKNPDGTSFAPRAPALRSKRGTVRRKAMFAKMRTARHMKMTVTSDSLAVGYSGRNAVIARTHQYGATRKDRSGRRYVTPSRRLLGLTNQSHDDLATIYLEALAVLEAGS